MEGSQTKVTAGTTDRLRHHNDYLKGELEADQNDLEVEQLLNAFQSQDGAASHEQADEAPRYTKLKHAVIPYIQGTNESLLGIFKKHGALIVHALAKELTHQ